MKKKLISQSGLFNPRILFGLGLCLAGVFLSMLSFAGTGSSGKFSRSNSKLAKPNSTASTTSPALAAPTSPGMPRYYNYAPNPGIGEGAGEPSVGFNPVNKKVMYIAGLQTLQATLPENITPPGSVPAACNADWLNVSYTATSVRSVDAILFTDQGTGRTFVSQLNTVTQTNPVLIGLNSLMAYTDDDGANWTPVQINPPDGSNDHETVGAGPYPPALSALANSVNKGHAVYYCGQLGTVNAGSTAFCSRSDDGGLNFGKSIPVYQDTVNACTAAIHGHVKVAPDTPQTQANGQVGTAYLPNGQCGGKQSVFVSTNAGTTWTLHTIPGSLPMANAIAPATFDISDPSVGVANDGTVYFAYTGLVPGGNSTDNHIFAAVSHDQGSTWSTPVDVGASQGIKNAVFASAVAGDPQRGAVAFIGTTTGGDHQGASFNGTWYGFVAHTYDGGQTWTTVNASGGPVQRNACIWNSGGNNTCRNLLDFNDATMDDKGFVLFAYADGCVNECETGGPNSYSSKATIARQSGGKSLLGQFDLLEPTLPQRACLSGCRDDQASFLSLVPPDNGGSDITGYNIYRSDATHAEALIGQQTNPTDNTFTDRSVDPTVTSYTYRVTAVNGLGEGPFSNSVSLPLGVCAKTTGPCALPGVPAIVDPAGDETDTLPAHDITSVSVAEPITNALTGAASNVVITIKVASFKGAAGNFTIPEAFRWSIRFGVIKNGVLLTAPSSGIPADTSVSDYFVAMASDGMGPGGGPSFDWGVTSTPNGAARVFTNKGTIDPSSNATADGTITLVVPKSIIQNPGPGDSIALTLASVRGALPSGTNETIFDSTGAGSYVLRASNLCLPNNPPLAVLNADVDEGVVPLQVNFNASASSDPDTIDTIASYTFNFGDGGDDVTQASPTISHTFSQNGEYIVRLVVTDSRGKVSSNTARFLVEVNPPLSTITSRKVHGAAGPFDILLPVSGTAGIECRAPDANNGYQLIFTFARNITDPGQATKGSGNVTVGTATIGPNPNQVTVPLTDVANVQHLLINLGGVHDAAGAVLFNLSARMDVLIGDTNADRFVDSADIGLTKSQSGKAVTSTNFREDLNVDDFLDSADIGLVKSKSGTALP